MNISTVKHITNPGTIIKPNEDKIIIFDNLFVVIDGATGLGEKKISSTDSDAQWFVNYISDYFSENWNSKSQFIPFLREALNAVNSKYLDLINNSENIKPFELPSAGLAAVQIFDKHIIAYRIGDCSLYIKNQNSVIDVFGDSPLNALDQKSISMLTRELKKGLSITEARENIKDILKQNRSKMNQKDGYSVITIHPDSINGFEKKKIDLLKNTELLLTSDGFSAFNEKYEFPLEEVFQKVNKNSLDDVIKELREIESNDDKLLQFPRLKAHDDATCIYLEIE